MQSLHPFMLIGLPAFLFQLQPFLQPLSDGFSSMKHSCSSMTGRNSVPFMGVLCQSYYALVIFLKFGAWRVERQGSLTDNIWPAKRCFSNYFKLHYILNLLEDKSQAVVNEDIMSQLAWIMFLHSMDLAYAAADLVVSRAGAMTCYEILATGKPSILVINLVHLLTNFSSP
ncbi:hypothetical protein RHSIM_Rhsim08G0129800 [Rhododendron simsii]|uniref:Glycosyl transferase family 28 C-terminal domain-containing protein n=1 Tax=Rhododendron simsii TaxID=118357 RepID=A0A834GJ54_RHOSS|nr:hypothetical protein RHSIM_Rhsim08G0129800 [Rhododendron simsii]